MTDFTTDLDDQARTPSTDPQGALRAARQARLEAELAGCEMEELAAVLHRKPPGTRVERRSSAAGTRLTAPANVPSTRMMRLSPRLTPGIHFCTTQGSRKVTENMS